MGKYSNISVSTILSAINGLYALANNEKDDISDTFNNYKSSSVKNITNSIQKVIGSGCKGSVGNLKSKLDSLKNACNKITEYNNIEKNIESLKPKLYYYEFIMYTSQDIVEKTGQYGYYEQRTDMNIYNQIQNLEKTYKQLEKELDNLLS